MTDIIITKIKRLVFNSSALFLYNPQNHSTSSMGNRSWVFFILNCGLLFMFFSWCGFFLNCISVAVTVGFLFLSWHFLYAINIFNVPVFYLLIAFFILLVLPPIFIFELIFFGFTLIWISLS